MILNAALLVLAFAPTHMEDFKAAAEANWDGAFSRFVAKCAAEKHACKLELDCADYRFGGPIFLSRTMLITGCGGGLPNAGSLLMFPKNSSGLIITSSAAWSVIRDVALVSGGGDRGSGIIMKARAHIEDVSIQNFPESGILMASSLSTGVNDNLNNFYLEHVSVYRSGKDGINISGVNASAGIGLGLNLKQNCWFATDAWCAALHDSSFLGNLFLGPVIHTTRSILLSKSLPAIILEGNNSAGLVINGYREFDSAPDKVEKPNMMLWGIGRTSTTTRVKQYQGLTIDPHTWRSWGFYNGK